MQIDLFSDSSVYKDMQRLLRQIETRKFTLDFPVNNLHEVCKDTEFVGYLDKMIDKPREYKRKFECSYDTHFALEALGIGTNCKNSTLIIDFGDKLDYVLHRITGCSMENVRKLADYDKISRSILSADYKNLQNIKVSDITSLDEKIAAWTNELLSVIADLTDLSDSEKLSLFLFRFYGTLIREVNTLKNYVMMFIYHKFDNVVIRSKSLCCMLATTDNDNIELKYNLHDNAPAIDDVSLQVYKLKPLEFYTGGIYHVFSWAY